MTRSISVYDGIRSIRSNGMVKDFGLAGAGGVTFTGRSALCVAGRRTWPASRDSPLEVIRGIPKPQKQPVGRSW